jgi:hypothetical protein
MRRPSLFILTTALAALSIVLPAHALSGPVRQASLDSHASARPSITVRVDDRHIAAPVRMPAGYVDIHIIAAGKIRHHLSFWHLNTGVSMKRFMTALNSPSGPFKVATAVGGNAPMLPGRIDITLRLTPGAFVLADIVDGPTHVTSFHVAGPPVSTRAPAAAGTAVNRGFRFTLPAHFGRSGVYRFTNRDPVAHDGVIYSLRDGKSAGDLVRWLRAGGKGVAPVDFTRPLGGPGPIAGNWTSWFVQPRLPRGRYVLSCFLPDDHGVPHAALGMVAGFEVT